MKLFKKLIFMGPISVVSQSSILCPCFRLCPILLKIGLQNFAELKIGLRNANSNLKQVQ